MPGLIFSSANAALAAYGEVLNNGSSATTVVGSPGVDSGVGQFSVERLGTGKVAVNLPTGFGQPDGRSLVFCQPIGEAQCSVSVVTSSATQKMVYTYVGASLVDRDFEFMIFQNTLPNP
jgi:hypothetical protein